RVRSTRRKRKDRKGPRDRKASLTLCHGLPAREAPPRLCGVNHHGAGVPARGSEECGADARATGTTDAREEKGHMARCPYRTNPSQHRLAEAAPAMAHAKGT